MAGIASEIDEGWVTIPQNIPNGIKIARLLKPN
jgi:hypothetical protein